MKWILPLLFITVFAQADGLKKSFDFRNTGVTADHFEISQVVLNHRAKQLSITLHIYTNKAAKAAGKDPLSRFTVQYNGSFYPFAPTAAKILTLRSDLYTILKNKTPSSTTFNLSGATDDN